MGLLSFFGEEWGQGIEPVPLGSPLLDSHPLKDAEKHINVIVGCEFE